MLLCYSSFAGQIRMRTSFSNAGPLYWIRHAPMCPLCISPFHNVLSASVVSADRVTLDKHSL